MKFRKMHGLGNDFVIFDARTENLFLTPEDMALIADRHWGVGCDLITVLDESQEADVAAFFFNADGSESAACGNATRCVADLVMNEKGVEACTIQTGHGVLECTRENDLITVNMGKARSVKDTDLDYKGFKNPADVDMGNPHCVLFVDEEPDNKTLEEIGTYFENHNHFPNRANVEFVVVNDKGSVRQRTWERGVGITQACGSGACAVAAAAVHRGLTDKKVDIELDGGILTIHVRDDGHIMMTGPVAYVFEGVLKENE